MENTGEIAPLAPPAPEENRRPEGQEGRRKILNALKLGIDELRKDTENPESTTQEKKWVLKAVTDAEEKCKTEGDFYRFTNTFEDFENQTQISQKEGVPVDDLISFLREKAKTYPSGSNERTKIFQAARILFKNSSPLADFPYQNNPDRYLGRTRQEAKFISFDYRATGNLKEDWYKAEKVLTKRRILVVPPPTAAPQHQAGETHERRETEQDTPHIIGGRTRPQHETPRNLTTEEEEMRGRVPTHPIEETPAIEELLTPEEEGMRDIVATHPIEEETPAPEPVPETLTEEERELRDRVPTHEIEEETPATEGTPAETPPPETSPEAPSPTTPIEDVRKEYSAILGNRQMDVRKRAEDMAERAIQLEQSRGRWFNPLSLGRKIKIRVLEEYFRQQYIARAETAMENNNNTFLEWDVVRNVSGNVNANIDAERQAGLAKIQEVGAGGTRQAEVLRGGTEEVRIAEGEFKTALMNEIITPAANGTIDYQELQTRLRNLVNDPRFADEAQVRDLFGADANRYGEAAQYFATDIFDMAQRIRTDQAAHTFALGELDDRVTINLANLDWAAQSNPRFTGADRAIAWAQRNRVRGWIANPAVIGAATSIGLYGGLRAVGMGARGAAATFGIIPGAGILTGGAFAAIRRNHDLKIDRASDQREQAYNNGDAVRRGRREALRRYNYNIATIDELVNGGERNGEPLGGDTRGINELLGTDLTRPENQEALERRMAEIISRMDTSGGRSIDLITFRSEYGLQNDRLELVRLVAQGRIALRNAGLEDRLVEERLTGLQGEWNNFFEGDQQNQDRRFRNYRLRNAGGAFLFGGIAGFASGLAVKEISGGLVSLTGKDVSIRGAFTAAGKGVHEAAKPAAYVKDKAGEALGKIPYVAEGLEDVGNAAGSVKDKLAEEVDRLPGVGRTHENGSERFKNFYANGGATDTDKYHLLVDQNTHNVTIVDKATANIVLNNGVTVDASGHIQAPFNLDPQVREDFAHSGFTINPTEHTETILNASDQVIADNTLGKSVNIPPGTEWIHDATDPTKFDLVVTNHPNQILVDNASLGANGKLIFESQSENIFLSVHEQTIPGETQTIFGENGVWDKNGTEIAGRQWYGNNTPGVSDLNELRAYNSLFTASNGQKGVVWDMSKMEPNGSFQTGNTPPSVDVQKIIHDGEAVFAFSTHDHQGNPIIIRDISDGVADGKFVLNPTDTIHHIDPTNPNSMTVAEFSQLMLNQEALQKLPDGSLASELFNHRDVFNLGRDGKNGFMEAAKVALGPNGEKRLLVFATGQGNGQAPEQIIGAPRTAFEHIFTLENPITEKVPGVEFIPPGEGDEIPVIPIPFAPRHPLEPLRGRGLPLDRGAGYPYGAGYSRWEMTPEQTRTFYENRRSETLRRNPDADLDFNTEAHNYLNKQSPEYLEQLNNYLSQEGMSEPMDKECEAVVCVPVYDLGEGQIIQNTLEQYYLQIDKARNKSAVDPQKVELILFLNHPFSGEAGREKLEQTLEHPYSDGAEERVRRGKPEIYDTEEVIRQFHSAHPELKIRIMKNEFANRPQWGKIIKPLYDISIMRATERKAADRPDPLIITNDADVTTLSPAYINSILNESSKKTAAGEKFDGFGGKVDMPNHGYERYPGFLAAMRFHQFLDAQNRKKNKYVYTQGRNTILKGSIYAAIGGVNDNTDAGGDTELGAMVSHARKTDGTIKYINRAWLHTDPRRELGEWEKGVPIVYAWNRWAAMDVYGKEWKSKFNKKPQDPSKIDKDFLETEIQEEVKWWRPNPQELSRALMFLGFKPRDYHTDSEGRIKIDNLNNVINRLKAYISEERWEVAERKKRAAMNESTEAKKGTMSKMKRRARTIFRR